MRRQMMYITMSDQLVSKFGILSEGCMSCPFVNRGYSVGSGAKYAVAYKADAVERHNPDWETRNVGEASFRDHPLRIRERRWSSCRLDTIV
jgi:hypothetical protein